jgi:hypothetical protein
MLHLHFKFQTNLIQQSLTMSTGTDQGKVFSYQNIKISQYHNITISQFTMKVSYSDTYINNLVKLYARRLGTKA